MNIRRLLLNQNKIPAIIAAGSCALALVFWGVVWWTFPRSTPAAVLHYSSGMGVDYIGEGNRILVLPGAATALVVTNLLLWQIIKRASKKAAWIFIGIVPILVVLLLTAYILLWQLNL